MSRLTDKEKLRVTLRELRDWAGLESRVLEHPAALQAWQAVYRWAEGAAQVHRINLDEPKNEKIK